MYVLKETTDFADLCSVTACEGYGSARRKNIYIGNFSVHWTDYIYIRALAFGFKQTAKQQW